MTSKAAGIHFIEKDKILLGRKAYGPLKGKWSGFGGSVEGREGVRLAAIREILEELYGLENIAQRVLRNISRELSLNEVYKSRAYTLFSADMSEIRKLNQIIYAAFRTVPFFGPRPPMTIQGFVKKFDSSRSANPEITEIAIFTFSEILSNPKAFDPYVLEDIVLFKR